MGTLISKCLENDQTLENETAENTTATEVQNQQLQQPNQTNQENTKESSEIKKENNTTLNNKNKKYVASAPIPIPIPTPTPYSPSQSYYPSENSYLINNYHKFKEEQTVTYAAAESQNLNQHQQSQQKNLKPTSQTSYSYVPSIQNNQIKSYDKEINTQSKNPAKYNEESTSLLYSTSSEQIIKNGNDTESVEKIEKKPSPILETGTKNQSFTKQQNQVSRQGSKVEETNKISESQQITNKANDIIKKHNFENSNRKYSKHTEKEIRDSWEKRWKENKEKEERNLIEKS